MKCLAAEAKPISSGNARHVRSGSFESFRNTSEMFTARLERVDSYH